MGVFARVSRRKRSLASVASLTAATLVVTTMAVLYQGVTTADVDLNDGGVWVTNPKALLAGRLNYPSEVLDAGLRAKGAAFDVEQEAGTVVLHDQSNATLAVVNTSSVTLNQDIPVPADSSVTLGGGVLAILDPAKGALWVRAADAVQSFNVASDEPIAELGAGAVATVATDGTVFAFSRKKSELTTVRPGAGASTAAVSGFAKDATIAVSAVGTTPILLDSAAGAVSIGGAAPVELGTADGLSLQKPGASGDAVAISSNSALLLQPLDGSAARSIEAEGSGVAVTPVVVNGCAYAAWTGSGRYIRDCGGSANDVTRAADDLVGDKSAVFRVNRNAVVINELTEGLVWLVNQDMKEVANWKDVTPPPDESDDSNENEASENQIQNTIPERTDANQPPIAADDEFGVRAGRSIILPVLDNDNDPDGDVLTASVLGAMPSIGTIQPIYGGQALQISVAAEASGTASFSYTADDGRGLSDDATVTLTVKPAGSNEAPEQKREGRVVVEQGASISYNVLPDWLDPDGDDLFLRTAAANSDGQVQHRADGLVTFDATGTEPGRKDVVVIVSDGTEDIEGVLHVDVRAPASVPPVTNPDHATTRADQPVTVAPLTNDLSASGGKLVLGNVDEVQGASVVPDFTTGTFTFTASDPKTYYLQYTANDGPYTEVGIVRIDVLPASAERQDPVAVRDVALLPAGGDVLVDVLQNDSDPTGGLLVVQSVTVPPTSAVAVAILEHEVLRVTDQPGITEPVVFQYTVSNGIGTATGEVLVVPVPAPTTLEPPVAADDSAIVRAGDTVTIDVLANDISPNGDTLTVAPVLVAPLPETADGTAFVSQDTLRFKAGDTAKTVYVTYEAVDASGQKDAGYVSIQVLPLNDTNNPPRPVNLEARALSGTTIRIPIPLDGIDPDGDSVALVGQASAPRLGRVEEVGDNYLSYTAFDGSVGTDVFRYEVRDALGASNTATVRVGVAEPSPQNQAPDAVKDVVTAQPGRRIAVDVLANDTDPDGDTLSLVEEGLILPDGVTATVASGRVLVTTPEAEGDSAIQYTVADTRGAVAIGSLLVTVANEAALVAPIARDDTVTAADIGEAATVEVPVLKNDEDPDGVASELTVALLGSPAGAAASAEGIVTVTPSDTAQIITYTATDADGLVGTAFIRVPALSSTGPSLKAGVAPLEVKAGEQATIPLSDWVVASEGESVRLTQADRVSAIHSADGVYVMDETTLLYTAAPDYFGSDALTFEVTDGTGPDDPKGVKATLSIPITVLPPENQPPTFAGGAVQVAPGESASTLDLRALSADPDKGDLEKLSYSVTGAQAGISATVSGSILSVTADESVAKGTTLPLDVTVTDGTTSPVQGRVVVTVGASARPLAVANDDVVAEARQGKPTTVAVLGNDVNPFPDAPLTLPIEPTVDTPGAGSAVRGGSNVVVTPSASFVGTMIVRYQVADATNDPERYVFGSIRLTVQGKPAAPGAPSVSSVQDGTVVLSWSDGTNNGSPIATHTVKWKGGSQECVATTCTIAGLTNGTEYTFTVTASNAIGESDPSPASAAVRPDARPGAPTITSVDYGDGSLTLTWSDGANPGSAITGYDLSVTGAANQQIPLPAGTRSKELTGLSNGAQYTVAVRARNSAPEPSEWSAPMSVTPAGAPSAPGVPSVGAPVSLGSQSQLPVSWSPPGNTNGGPLTGYTLVVKNGGSEVDRLDLSPGQTSQNITLSNSESSYTFSVGAKNKATDEGKAEVAFSADSAPRRAVGAPGTPVITNAEEGDNAITNFRWTAGPGNGVNGNEISYVYDLNGDGIRRPASETLTNGIANNGVYAVRVKAVATVDGNPLESEWSAPTAQLAPYGRPFPPTIEAIVNGPSITFVVTPPAPNGAAPWALHVESDSFDIDHRGGRWDPVTLTFDLGDGYGQYHELSAQIEQVDPVSDESEWATLGAWTADAPLQPEPVQPEPEPEPPVQPEPPAQTSWSINVPDTSCAEDSDSSAIHFSPGPSCSSYWVQGTTTVYCYSDWSRKNNVGDYRWYRMGDGWYVSRASTDDPTPGMPAC